MTNALPFVSPTRLAWLLRCQYKVFLDVPGKGPADDRRQAALLGRCVHYAIERLIEANALVEDLTEATYDFYWAQAVREIVGDIATAEAFPGYYIKRARIRNAVERLRAIIGDLDIQSEVELVSPDGLIHGTADLIASGPGRVVIADYKSGVHRDPDTGIAEVDDYTRQIQLYAYLLASSRGIAATEGYIIPLDGPALAVQVSEDRCQQVADEALAILASFNAEPSRPPASPGPSACRFCPHVARCGPFQAGCDPTWAPEFLAGIGDVVEHATAATGAVSIGMNVVSGSIPTGRANVVRLDPLRFPQVAELREGDRVVIANLRPYSGLVGSYDLSEWGQVGTIGDEVD